MREKVQNLAQSKEDYDKNLFEIQTAIKSIADRHDLLNRLGLNIGAPKPPSTLRMQEKDILEKTAEVTA